MSQNHKFKSGASSSEHMVGYDQIPYSFLNRLAKRFDLGAKKYGKFNYRKGLKDKEFIIDRLNHAFNHLKLAIDQIENDEVMNDDDLAAVGCNIAMAMEYQESNDMIPD